jgi:hypothetical protein
VEAHRSYERFEQNREAAGSGLPHATRAALVVAIMAAFLAVSAFLANKTVKEVITGETQRAEATAKLETNLVKIDVASGNSDILRTLAAGGHDEAAAASAARAHEAHVAADLAPADRALHEEIAEHEQHVSDYDEKHLDFELAEVGLEVGIVLASVSIIARREWLLGAGGAIATAGVVFLVIGLSV